MKLAERVGPGERDAEGELQMLHSFHLGLPLLQ